MRGVSFFLKAFLLLGYNELECRSVFFFLFYGLENRLIFVK